MKNVPCSTAFVVALRRTLVRAAAPGQALVVAPDHRLGRHVTTGSTQGGRSARHSSQTLSASLVRPAKRPVAPIAPQRERRRIGFALHRQCKFAGSMSGTEPPSKAEVAVMLSRPRLKAARLRPLLIMPVAGSA